MERRDYAEWISQHCLRAVLKSLVQTVAHMWRQHHPNAPLPLAPPQSHQLPVRLLGDVFISIDTAAEQAAQRGHSLEQELRVLLVHGLLHLLGRDH